MPVKLSEKKVERLIQASVKFVEFYERHLAYEENKTKDFQKAANLAREGKQREAKMIVQKYDNSLIVFDYSLVNKDMVEAVKPFRYTFI